MRIDHVGGRNLVDFVVPPCESIDERYVGVFTLKVGIQVIEIVGVALGAVLVADLHIPESERGRMPVGGTHGAVFGRYIAGGVLDGMLYALQKRLQILFSRYIVAVSYRTGESGIGNEHCVHIHIFAELQELMITETVRITVSPQREFARARHGIADGFLPFHTVAKSDTFYYAAAGPAEKCGAEIGEFLRNVGAHAVLASHKRVLRKERHIQQKIAVASLHAYLVAVDVNGIGHGLEGVKGNTDRQGQSQKGNAAAGQFIERADKEIRIFKNNQQS